MKQTARGEEFEKVLLCYVETCYSVALALTRDAHKAEELAHDVLARAWRLGAKLGSSRGVKMELLGMLRKRFIKNYQQPNQAVPKYTESADTREAPIWTPDQEKAVLSGALREGRHRAQRAVEMN